MKGLRCSKSFSQKHQINRMNITDTETNFAESANDDIERAQQEHTSFSRNAGNVWLFPCINGSQLNVPCFSMIRQTQFVKKNAIEVGQHAANAY